MHKPNGPVSLADLSAAGVRLRPYEATTLVRELVLQAVRGEIAGVPSAHVIRLSSDGTVSVEGPVAAGGRSVERAAELLDSLLPASESVNQFRVPGGLRLVVARALGTLDLPPFESLEVFANALARFAATDAAATITNLVMSWAEAVASQAPEPTRDETVPAPLAQFNATRSKALIRRGANLTVSDIRRARRATGTPLTQVAERSRIPVGLLRQLEWGYLQNWPSGHIGRKQLIRYARAAGLDEQVVISTLEPLIEEAESRRSLLVLRPIVPALERRQQPVVEIDVVPVRHAAGGGATRKPRLGTKALAALAIPALLAVGVFPAWWALTTVSPDRPGHRVAENNGDRPQSTDPEDASRAPARSSAAAVEPASAGGPDAHVSRVPTMLERGVAEKSPRTQSPTADPKGTGKIATAGLMPDGVAQSPFFASVGTAMFYHTGNDGRATLVRAGGDSHGSVLRITRIVDDASSNFHLRLSPDGSRIAFDSDRAGARGVYVADADGRNLRRVSPEGFAAIPSWSPDGTKLAFVRAEPADPEVWNLWTLELDSGDLRQITRHSAGQPWGGSWFPDGKRLAYSHDDRLMIKDLRSGVERVFPSPRRGRVVRMPAVSPDGRRIVFQVHREGVWLLDLRDESMRRVLEDPTAEEYTWSPDGMRVAYHSRKSDAWGVWVMAPR